MESTPKFTITEGILIILLTFAAFGACYFYEYGACQYYEIPTSYIDINLSRSLPLAFISLSILYYISIIDPVVRLINNKEVSWILKVSMGLFVLFAIIYAMWKESWIGFLFALHPSLFLTFIFGGIMYGGTTTTNNKETINLQSIVVTKLLQQFGGSLAISIMVFSFFLYLLSVVGYYAAKHSNPFYIKNNSSLVLLKRYGNANIYGYLKSDTLEKGKLLIEEGESRTDTLKIAKFKILIRE
jgi:hypothetical protein